MGQPGFFDLQHRYEGLDAHGDPLVAINAAVPFEMFRLKLKTALIKGGSNVIPESQGHQGDRDLRGPNEVGSAQIRGKHLGAQNLDDHDGSPRDRGGGVKVTA